MFVFPKSFSYQTFVFPLSGASAATMLIFILPAAFYLRLVKKEPLRSPQKIGVSIPEVTSVDIQSGTVLKSFQY